jgi:Neuraminidase (sialidase)
MRCLRFVLLLTLAFTAWEGAALHAQGLFEQTELFVGGQDNYLGYRIPALICTKKGTILAFGEGRKDEGGDGVPTDIVLKRSLGNAGKWTPPILAIGGTGRSRRNTIMWQSLQVVFRSVNREAYMNPVPVIDQSDGSIYLLVNIYPQPYKDEPADILLVRSTDEGATWSQPVNITAGTGKHELGPGIGIQLQSGRLVVSGYDAAIFSDDHGKTWKHGGVASGEPNETQVVELVDGTLMFNRRGRPSRVILTSPDKGETWSKWAFDDNLPDADCQGSFIRYTRKDQGSNKNRLLFANPVSDMIGAGMAQSDPRGRFNVTVHVSYDEGKTWPVARVIHKGPGAYSSMTVFPDGSIGILYETGDTYDWFVEHYQKMVFARFTLEWLTDGKDHLEKSQP